MYDLRKNFFTHTTFTIDEYAQVGIGNLDRYIQRMVECRRMADDPKTVFDRLYIHKLRFSNGFAQQGTRSALMDFNHHIIAFFILFFGEHHHFVLVVPAIKFVFVLF